MAPDDGPGTPTGDDTPEFQRLIVQARAGDQNALGRLVDSSRGYLLLIANQELNPDIRPKVGASDIVQESLLTAQANLHQFKGESTAQWLAWLKQILVNDLRQTHRNYRQIQKRSIEREQNIDATTGGASLLVDLQLTPRSSAVRSEEIELLSAAIAELPEDYQRILKMRNWEQLTYEEIGERLNRSPDAVRKTWGRAVIQLQRRMSPAADVANDPPANDD